MELYVMLCINIVFLTSVVESEYVGERDSVNWTTFDWKLRLERAREDSFVITELHNEDKIDNIQIAGAICETTSPVQPIARSSASNPKREFEKRCKCATNSSSFAPDVMQCVPNKKLRKECKFTAGSYQWLTDWTWDTMDDVLMVLDALVNGSMVITMGFNASTQDHEQCTLQSIDERRDNGSWAQINLTLVDSIKPIFFKLKRFWHVSWNIEDMSTKGKGYIQGKVLKFMITCGKISPNEQELMVESVMTSCLIFKASGSLQFTSNYVPPPTTEPPPTTKQPSTTKPPSTTKIPSTTKPPLTTEPSPSTETQVTTRETTTEPSTLETYQILIIVVALVTMLFSIILVYWLFRRKKACFAVKRRISLSKPAIIQQSVLNDVKSESFV